jgi:hypothetical protein
MYATPPYYIFASNPAEPLIIACNHVASLKRYIVSRMRECTNDMVFSPKVSQGGCTSKGRLDDMADKTAKQVTKYYVGNSPRTLSL